MEHMVACGMHLCKKCSVPTAIFGLLFLVQGLGLWAGAPVWFNVGTLIGVYLLVLGLTNMMGMDK